MPTGLIKLSKGSCYYDFYQGSAALPVIFISGISKPSYVFDGVFEILKSKGISVLRYDHWGRGRSDRPETVYNQELFVRQLDELTEALNIKVFHLAGFSMGALVAAAYIHKFPQKVKSVFYIAPAGYERKRSLGEYIFTLPVLGEAIWFAAGRKILMRRNLKNVYQPHLYPEFQSRYDEQMKVPGYLKAILSTMRNMDFDMSEKFRQTAALNIPAAFMWGDQDEIISPSRFKYFHEDFQKAQLHIIRGAGHECVFEKPDECAGILNSFFSRIVK